MKNYFKIVVIVFGISITVFSSVVSAREKEQNQIDCLPGNGVCGTTADGTVLIGKCGCN